MINSFDEFLVSSSAQIPMFNFIFNFVLTGLFSTLLGELYLRYGSSLSDRKRNNFLSREC